MLLLECIIVGNLNPFSEATRSEIKNLDGGLSWSLMYNYGIVNVFCSVRVRCPPRRIDCILANCRQVPVMLSYMYYALSLMK